MGYDSWKAREPDEMDGPHHEWMEDAETGEAWCVRCGRPAGGSRVPLLCLPEHA
jgi:hypothetical protein